MKMDNNLIVLVGFVILGLVTWFVISTHMNADKKTLLQTRNQSLTRTDTVKVRHLDHGIIVKVRNNTVTAELVAVTRECLNPVWPPLNGTTTKDTTIVINLKTGKTAGYK